MTLGQLSQLVIFCWQIAGLCPRYPTHHVQLCLYQSLPSHWWVKNKKNGNLWRRFGHFTRLTKIAKNAIFQFSTRFLKTFPSTHLDPQYHIKNPEPSSTRICPKRPRVLTHGRAIARAKCTECGGTVGMVKFVVRLEIWFWQSVFANMVKYCKYLRKSPPEEELLNL